MELNNEILSALNLINSTHIEHDDLVEILRLCHQDMASTCAPKNSTVNEDVALISQSSDDKNIIRNLLTFAIKSLILEAAKNNVRPSSLIHLLREHKIDCDSDHFKLFSEFLHSVSPKVRHNLERTELSPLPKFRDLEWSQMIAVKSSTLDHQRVKEKNYLMDFYVANAETPEPSETSSSVFSLTLSQKELQDLHFTLRDCAKSIENYLNK